MHAISKGSGKSAHADLPEHLLITYVISSKFHALAQMCSWKDETDLCCIKFIRVSAFIWKTLHMVKFS